MAQWISKENWNRHRQRQIQNLFLTVAFLSLAVLLIAVPREYRTTAAATSPSSKSFRIERIAKEKTSSSIASKQESINSRGKTAADPAKNARNLEEVACDLSNYRTAVCRLSGDVRVSRSTVTLVSSEISDNQTIVQKIKPYPRKWQKKLLEQITEVTIERKRSSPQCDVKHKEPAIIFSTGGYTGSVYHDFNDGLIPMYITSHRFKGEVVFFISEFKPWWMKKYGGIIKQLTRYPIQDLSSNRLVHCFSQVVVGLEIHDELAINPVKMPNGGSIGDFQSILSVAFSNPERSVRLPIMSRPKLVFITRRRTRVVTNEREVVDLAERVGFDVEAFEPSFNQDIAKLYRILQSADVLLGVHGAALTHLLFLRPGSVLLQIVPLGTKSPAWSFYGNPAVKAGLQYVEYVTELEESSLLQRFGKNHSVIVSPPENPGSSWGDMKKIYLDIQNVTISLQRFEPVLRQVFGKLTNTTLN